MIEIQEKKDVFKRIVEKCSTKEEAETILNSFSNLEKINTFFEKEYKLNVKEVDILATAFTNKYSEENISEITKNYLENPVQTMCELYQEFLNSKNYPENIVQDLSCILNYIVDHEEEFKDAI